MHEKILSLAKAILSPSAAEAPILDALCSSAEVSLSGKLGPGIAPTDCGEAFPCAAAMLAAAAFLPCREENGISAFTAGDVHMTLDSTKGSSASQSLRREAQSLMAPFCGDGGFSFLGVQG